MNDALLLPQRTRVPSIGTLFAPSGTLSDEASKQLSNVAVELIRGVLQVLDELVSSAIERRTAAEFEAARASVFPKYLDAVQALSSLTEIVVPKPTLERLTAEFFSKAESDFGKQGLAAFGAAVSDQACFTIWTLRKIDELAHRIVANSLNDDFKEADLEILEHFTQTSTWARFHLHCLMTSLRLRTPIYPEVLDVIQQGLRAIVNAYAWARRGLDLRLPEAENLIPTVEWDDEDQQLLDEANRDNLPELP